MKIAIAQIRSVKADILANIETHKKFVGLASTFKATAIFFPELSLTSYEPKLARELATSQNDPRLDIFQQISNTNKIAIGLGLPTRTSTGIRISMVIFQPYLPRQTYSKQKLHSDEFQYFENSNGQILITIGNDKIAPAICYESLQPDHSDNAFRLGATVYVASVAKSDEGIDKAMNHFTEVAKKYTIPVLLSNNVGLCDNFIGVGKSSAWTKEGVLAAQLDEDKEGLLIFDTETEEVAVKMI